MALFRALVYREWVERDDKEELLPINTVHDSVMFDCTSEEKAREYAEVLERIAAQLPDELEQRWGIHCPLPFKVECETGKTWNDLEKL